jgi:hypothetical protein
MDWAAMIDHFMWDECNSPEAKANRSQGVFHPSQGLLGHEDLKHCTREIMFDLLCAPRSPTKTPAHVHRIFEIGHGREAAIRAQFKKMAEQRYMGILNVESNIKVRHPILPIAGEIDLIITMVNGYRYVADVKTINKERSKTTMEPELKYKLQLNTYLGIIGLPTAYVWYEQKDNCKWIGPMRNFRIDFDPELFAQTEQWCIDILHQLHAEQIPSFDDMPTVENGECKAEGCSYQFVCNAHRGGTEPLSSFDYRPEHIRKLHLKVVQ